VLTALLLAARNVVPALRYVDSLDGGAAGLEARVEEGKKQFAGMELPQPTPAKTPKSARRGFSRGTSHRN